MCGQCVVCEVKTEIWKSFTRISGFKPLNQYEDAAQ